MEEIGDPADYIKTLRDATYMLQKKCHRPANPLPEKFKKETLRLCSKILNWIFDIEYIGPEDIKIGVKKNLKIIEEKSKELEKQEKDADAEKGTYCFAKTGDGTYAKFKKEDVVTMRSGREVKPAHSFNETNNMSADVEWRESKASASVDPKMLKGRHGRCACMGITDGDIRTVLKCASSWKDIEELDLRGNRLQDAGMQRLVSGLSSLTTLPQLKRLRVGGNESGPLGAQVLIGLTYLRKSLEVCAEWDEEERGPLTREVHKEVGIFYQEQQAVRNKEKEEGGGGGASLSDFDDDEDRPKIELLDDDEDRPKIELLDSDFDDDEDRPKIELLDDDDHPKIELLDDDDHPKIELLDDDDDDDDHPKVELLEDEVKAQASDNKNGVKNGSEVSTLASIQALSIDEMD